MLQICLNNPTGQTVIKGSNNTLKERLIEQKREMGSLRDRLHSASLTLNLLNANEQKPTAAERPWIMENPAILTQHIYTKDVLTSE